MSFLRVSANVHHAVAQNPAPLLSPSATTDGFMPPTAPAPDPLVVGRDEDGMPLSVAFEVRDLLRETPANARALLRFLPVRAFDVAPGSLLPHAREVLADHGGDDVAALPRVLVLPTDTYRVRYATELAELGRMGFVVIRLNAGELGPLYREALEGRQA